MKTYTITDPSGKVHTIDGPEGATREQVIAKIQERLSSTQQQPQVDPYTAQAQKQTIGQNLLAGIGGGMTGLYLGAKQRLGMAKPEEIEQHRQAMQGLRSTTAGTIGDIGGQIAAAVPAAFIPGANTYTGAALIGGGLGALQPTMENESVVENAALGAAGGVIGKYAGDKLLKFLRGRNAGMENQLAMQSGEELAGLNQPTQDLLKKGQSMGFKSTPGQASGSKTLQKFEAALESNPFTSGVFDDIKTHNAGVLNRVTAKSIGENSDYVNATVLEQAKDRIGAVYKMVADKNVRAIPADDFASAMRNIDSSLEGLLPANVSFIDNPLVKNFIDVAQKGQATGEQLQQIASKLGKAAAKNMTTQGGDRDLGMALFKVKDMADDYLRSGLKGETAKAFDAARGQYRNLMMLTSRTGVVNTATGDVSKTALPNVLASKDKAGYVFNKNQSDLYNAARYGDAFRPIVGDSGTATRSMSNLSLENLAKLPFGLVARLYASQPMTQMAGATGQFLNQGAAPGLGQMLQIPLQRGTPLIGAQVGANANSQR